MELSIVVPLYNERDNLAPLHEELARVLGATGVSYEMLFVDDGSTDGGADVLRAIKAADAHVRVIRLARNSGQTAGPRPSAPGAWNATGTATKRTSACKRRLRPHPTTRGPCEPTLSFSIATGTRARATPTPS